LNEQGTGYLKLMASVEHDISDKHNGNENCRFHPEGCICDTNQSTKCFHRFCDKFKWVTDRAQHYAEKLGLSADDVLDSWEANRSYWYMNYYQGSNQPEIKSDSVKVFERLDDLRASLGDAGFRCPSCGKVSKSPYECNHCDWKVYGLLGHMGRGINVYVKEKLKGQDIFMPIAWEAP
jgi:hypothetical protein